MMYLYAINGGRDPMVFQFLGTAAATSIPLVRLIS